MYRFFVWIVLSVCVVASNAATSAEDRLHTVTAEIMVTADGQVGNYAIYGVSGWVEMEFTITVKGTVEDIEITRASHKGLFRRAAKRAMARWKISPRIIDGVAVERHAIQVVEFQMEPVD